MSNVPDEIDFEIEPIEEEGSKVQEEPKIGEPIKAEEMEEIREQLQKKPESNVTAIAQELPKPVLAPVQEEKILGIKKFRTEMREAGRVILPYLQLVQSMSDAFTQDEVPPGNFRNSLTGEDFGKEIEVLPLAIFHWRRRFVDRVPYCRSDDAITGVGDPGGACHSCWAAKWHVIRANGVDEEVSNARTFRAKKDEEMVAPLCSEQFVFPVVVLSSEYEVPGALVFHRSYLQEGLRFYSMIEFAPDRTVYKLTSAKTNNEKGTWFIPKLRISRKLSEEDFAKYSHYIRGLKNAVVDVEGYDETNGA